MSKRITTEEYKKQLFDKFNGNIECLEDYIDARTKILHICHKHNYEYKTSPRSLLQVASCGCKYCGIDSNVERFTKTTEQFKKEVYDLVGNEYEILSEYSGQSNDVKFKHICGNECHYFSMTPKVFLRGGRCYCKGTNKLIVGFNDMYTKRPDLVDLLYDKSEAYKNTINSEKIVEWICPNCGEIIKEKICNVSNYKLVCPKCSDGISYPNKFIYNILKEVNDDLDFLIREYKPKWCKYKLSNGKERYGIYDIYFGINGKKYIVEMDGSFHFKTRKSAKISIKLQNEIDENKTKLAKENNIDIIRIDCNYGETDDRFMYIKNNIINSKLSEVIDILKIDFDKCNLQSLNSLVIQTAEYWNKGFSTTEIKKILCIGNTTLYRYLKRCNEIGLITNYTKEESKKRLYNAKVKKHCSI